MNRLSIFFAMISAVLLFAGCANAPPAVSEPESAEPEPLSQQESTQGAERFQPEFPSIKTILPSFRESIAKKKEQNGDVVGWLQIPGTDIEDAVLQNPEGDNNYYLRHNFGKEPDKKGSYCADFRADFSLGLPQNIAIYGHNFSDDPDSELFAQLKRYKDPDFARSHPYLFFSTAESDMAWEVFAVLDIYQGVPYIIPELKGKTFDAVMDVVYKASIYDYGVTVLESDHLLAISCCTYSVPGADRLPLNIPNEYRFVVMARLVDPDNSIKDTAVFNLNNNPLSPLDMPDIYYEGQDLFIYNGFTYGRSFDDTLIESADTDSFVLVGEIRRSGVLEDLTDWDAIQLEAGTQIFRYHVLNDILIAKVGDEFIAYERFD